MLQKIDINEFKNHEKCVILIGNGNEEIFIKLRVMKKYSNSSRLRKVQVHNHELLVYLVRAVADQ